jgi:hypothetical protein
VTVCDDPIADAEKDTQATPADPPPPPPDTAVEAACNAPPPPPPPPPTKQTSAFVIPGVGVYVPLDANVTTFVGCVCGFEFCCASQDATKLKPTNAKASREQKNFLIFAP